MLHIYVFGIWFRDPLASTLPVYWGRAPAESVTRFSLLRRHNRLIFHPWHCLSPRVWLALVSLVCCQVAENFFLQPSCIGSTRQRLTNSLLSNGEFGDVWKCSGTQSSPLFPQTPWRLPCRWGPDCCPWWTPVVVFRTNSARRGRRAGNVIALIPLLGGELNTRKLTSQRANFVLPQRAHGKVARPREKGLTARPESNVVECVVHWFGDSVSGFNQVFALSLLSITLLLPAQPAWTT